MNIYTAPYVSGAPDWSAVPSAEIGNLLWTESCGVRAWAQMCWTEEALHLRLRAAERDIRAEERGLLGSRYHSAHPVVPLAQIVAVLNGDMVGRNHPDTAALLGTQPPHRNSPDLVAMALAANAATSRIAPSIT